MQPTRLLHPWDFLGKNLWSIHKCPVKECKITLIVWFWNEREEPPCAFWSFPQQAFWPPCLQKRTSKNDSLVQYLVWACVSFMTLITTYCHDVYCLEMWVLSTSMEARVVTILLIFLFLLLSKFRIVLQTWWALNKFSLNEKNEHHWLVAHVHIRLCAAFIKTSNLCSTVLRVSGHMSPDISGDT